MLIAARRSGVARISRGVPVTAMKKRAERRAERARSRLDLVGGAANRTSNVSVQVDSVTAKPAPSTILAASGSTIEVELGHRGDVADLDCRCRP